MNDRFQVKLLRREQRKTVSQIASQLVAEEALGACACAVASIYAIVEDFLQELKVGLHGYFSAFASTSTSIRSRAPSRLIE